MSVRDDRYFMCFRPSNDWQRQHRFLFNAVIHGYSAYRDFPKVFQQSMLRRFYDACRDCHCPVDLEDAIFCIMTGYETDVSVSLNYYYSLATIHKWRRRVIIAIVRMLLSDAALGYDV